MIKLHIINAGKRLDSFIPDIQTAFDEVIPNIKALLPIEDVDIVIEDAPFYAIPETGVGGSSKTAHLIHISLDPLSPHLKDNLQFVIKSTLAHELYHCARTKDYKFPYTLGEVMISEGLVAHFDLDVNGGEPKLWDKALTEEQLETYMPLALMEFNDKDYNYYEWAAFKDGGKYPRWTAYALGFKIVDDYLKAHPDMTAAELYTTPAEEFIA